MSLADKKYPADPTISELKNAETGVDSAGCADTLPTLNSSTARRVLENRWVAFLFHRIVSLMLVLLCLLILVFLMVRLIPGNPAEIIAGDDASPARIQEISHQLGLDKPFLTQFISYIGNVLKGDFGTSFQFGAPVSQMLRFNLPYSLTLAGAALALVLVISIPGGMFAAAVTRDGRRRRLENTFTTVTSITGSLPDFLSGTFLALIFAVWLHWLPIAGSSGLSSLVLPALALAIRPASMIIRIVRVETLNAMKQDYIRTARSKQLPERILYLRHALPNVLTGVLTIGGVMFTNLIAGAVVVENIFGRAGVGSILLQAIVARDYRVIQAVMLVLGATVIIVYSLLDILLAALDPRALSKVPGS